jgi:hypothetical protein
MCLRTVPAPTVPPILVQGLQHFAEGQHADQVAVFHDDQRTDVLFGHGVGGVGQRLSGETV